MPARLGTGVDGEMFDGGNGFRMRGIRPLQALDERGRKRAGEIRILAVCFLPSPPARIAKDIDIGRPDGQSLISAMVFVDADGVVFGARLGGNNVTDLLQ